VLQHVLRQLARKPGTREQSAYRAISCHEITQATGMDLRTIEAKLRGLATRRIVDLDPVPRAGGHGREFRVGLRLAVSDWRGVRLHRLR
jgi:hypothetical protein